MKEKKIKIIGFVIILMLIVFSTFVLLTQQQIREIDKDIKVLTDESGSVIIRADVSSGTSPLTINFKPILYNIRDNVTYFWSFGDGLTSNEVNPSHTYLNTGIFDCMLTIENTNRKIMDNINITVYPNNPPKIKIKSSETTPFRPETVYFDAEAFDPEGEELKYQWLLKYPPILGYEKNERYNTKNFSKWLWRDGNYVLELSVTDEAGNKATDYVIIQVGKSQIEQMVFGIRFYYVTSIPFLKRLWNNNPIIKDNVTNFIDYYWFNLSPKLQNYTLKFLSFLNWDYEPPIPKAKLEVSKISDINFSKYIDNNTGKVKAGAVASNSFTIVNNDSINISRNIYITLYKPFTNDEKGLEEEIEVNEIFVDLDAGLMSNKLFYNGNYTNWIDCYYIETLTPGSYITLNITVTLKEDAIFNKGLYQCKLYMYQSKSLDRLDYNHIDEIPFNIKI